MIRWLLRCLKGYVRIRIEGYSPERFLNICRHHRIALWGLAPSGGSYTMFVKASEFKKLCPLAKKTGIHLRVEKKHGLPFLAHRYRKRKLFFLSLLMGLILVKIYSLFIWDIHFEGNVTYPDITLARFLETKGVAPGIRRRDTDCQEIVKAIRKEYNDIVWVSASIDGSRLKVRVKENETVTDENTAVNLEQETPKDLIATKSGVITEIVTRSGVPLVHEGDKVKAGDILVRGRIEVLNDSKEVTGYQYCRADADIFADTILPYEDVEQRKVKEKAYSGKRRHGAFLEVCGYKVSAGFLKNSFPSSQSVKVKRQAKLGENYYLPLHWGYQEIKEYKLRERELSDEELRKALSAEFAQFCKELEQKGIQIREKNVKIHLSRDSGTAKGNLYLNERITEEADTEIITAERKETDESVGTDD